ncbi:nickel ABC transporter substrate-binding protein [Inediibacterium massiliense]|uniref:nickel ABC transporter substrate-binding protein n=1 Tax=Inediibacterium massiliense TaxID=1658111 RepID=UPI0006B69BCC|nr:nickel ABC transporter substrate-binding protein [Inediibacterium massiliense]
MRKKQWVKKLALGVISLMMIATVGCTSMQNVSSSNTPNEDKTITILESRALNPDVGEAHTGSAAISLYEAIYEPLIKYGEKGKYEPALAQRWEMSEDGKSYTFYLRKDVKFSDGADFNADSVILSAKRWDPHSFSSPMTGIEKIDDYTIRISFEKKSYPCLTEFTYPRPYRISSPNAYDDKTGKFKGMIGTGQWMIESYKSNQEVVLVPNPYYYGEKPKVEKLVLKEVPDGQSRLMALQSGEADISIASIPTENYQVVRDDKNLDIFEKEGTMGFYLIMNYENPIFQDINVRKALNYGIDKKSIGNDLLNGEGTEAKGLLPQTVPYVTNQNSKGYPFDTKKAAELLASSGYKDTDKDGILEKDGKKLSIRLVFQTEEYASWKSLCEYLQSAYAKIGIEVKPVLLESAAYYDAIWKTRDYDLIIYRTYEDSWNPHGFLRSLFYQSKGEKSVCWYDEDLNKNLDQVITIMDEKERQKKYDEIFKYIEESAVTVPLYYPKVQYVYNKRLKNIIAAPTSYEAIEWQLIEKK